MQWGPWRRALAACVGVVALVALACAPAQPAPAKQAAQEKPAAAAPAAAPAQQAPAKPAAQAGPAKVIRVGTCAPEKPESLSVAWVLAKFRDRVKERSNGQLDVQVYWAGALYCEVAALKAMLDGAVEIGTASVQNTGTFTRAFFALDMPFLFNTYDELEKAVILGPFNKRLRDLVTQDQPNMMHLFFVNGDGLRDLLCTKKVLTPADLRGIKIRTTETPTDVAIWKQLGATATPIAAPEIYVAGTQGLIQCIGVGAGYWPITFRWYEWTKFITLLDYQPQLNTVAMSKRFFDSLSPDQQKLVLETAAEVEKEGGRLDKEYSDKNQELLRTQYKQEIVTLTPEQKKEWVEKAKPVYDQFKDKIPAGLMEELQSYLKTLR